MNALPSAALGLGLALLAASPPSLNAQARSGGPAGGGDAVVRGSVVTPDDKPIALAIVELRVPRDSAPIRRTQSSDAGRFQLDSIGPGTYYLLIRRIGFGAATTTSFTVVAGQVRDLGRIPR